ncbi:MULTISPECIES: hypothetical protein [Sphingobacterium]|uniref:Plasmid transfer protein n=1 Tax=Sphingobacterium populi TaxID=1812824 RepID=A0ABW5U9A0_9SPHI|nr:hypothetical protein [Sphingobacterium sp. CFCC 11742]
MMRYVILTLLILVIALTKANAQLNVELLHQLVEHSKDEYDRQITARNKQAITSANEEVNREETAKLKTRYRELHSRFQVLGTALQGLSMGLESAPIVTEIINQQKRIIGIVFTYPEFMLLAIDAERDMAEKAVQLTRYLTGLFISISDLNQMKASDRRILYGHVLQELRAIAGASRGLAITMYYSTRKKLLNSLNPFSAYINEDKRIVDNILRQLEEFKP